MYSRDRLPGYIGLGLTLILWLLSSWRLLFHFFTRRRGNEGLDGESSRRRSSQRSTQSLLQRFTRKRTFHALLWMATSCEALAYADLSGLISIHKDPLFAEKLGYVLLDVAGRSILELLAFCTVTAIWLKTAIESSPAVLWGSQSTPFGILPTIFLITFFFLVFASASLSVIELVLYQDKSLADIERLPWGRAEIILEAVAWGVHSLVVLECLIVTSKRVLNLVPTLEWPKRLSLLSKAVLPMLVASIVYAVRCIWLLAIVCHRESIDRGTWIWWIGFAWVPTWLAVGFLLYSARKRDSTLDTQLEEPLLPARRPPAEAFMAFSRHRHGMDADDSFSVSRSPVKTMSATITENVVVADDEETTTLERGTVIDGITNEV